VRAVLEERGKRYGKFSAHSHISQALKNVMQQTPGWNRLKDYQKESLEMIMHKVARVLNGDPQYDDNWVDICGYSQLATDTLREETKNAH
jgi:nucleoid-associated protein YejK